MSLNDNVMTLKSVTFYILNYWMGFIFWQLKTINKKKKLSICATRKQTKHLHHLLHLISFSRYLFLIMNFDLSRMLKAKVHIQICHAIEKCTRLVLFALEIDLGMNLIFVFFEWFLLERSKRRGKKEGEIWKQGWQLVAV